MRSKIAIVFICNNIMHMIILGDYESIQEMG